MRRVIVLIGLVRIRGRHSRLEGLKTRIRVLVRLGVRIGLLSILLTWLRHLHLILLIRDLSQLKVGLWREDVIGQVIGYLLILKVGLLNLSSHSSFLNRITSKLRPFILMSSVAFGLHRLERTVYVFILKTLFFIPTHHSLVVALIMLRCHCLGLNSHRSSHDSLLSKN